MVSKKADNTGARRGAEGLSGCASPRPPVKSAFPDRFLASHFAKQRQAG